METPSSSAYTSICSSILFPLHERFKSHSSVEIRKRLEEQERWPIERLETWRIERLRAFLTRISNTVPIYQDLFSKLKFDPSRLASIAELQRLPLTNKTFMRNAGDKLRAIDAGPLSKYNTGGSSGEPLIFYIGKDRKSHDVGAKWRVTRWWGVDIGDPEIVVWGSPIELRTQDRVKVIRDRILRSELLPAFQMSKEKLDKFVFNIIKRRPAMIFGYPSALSLIATHAKKLGKRLDNLGIQVAFVTSERLYDEQRAAISEIFGCPVANGYGARDAGFIAHECPEGNMHLQAEDVIVEIVSPSGEVLPIGESGEIVVTHMATHEFPFLRYRTGDIGKLSNQKCTCGRSLPVLGEIEGRTTDFIVAADGTVMHGLALIYSVRDLPGVERFKIIQKDIGHIEVLIVANTQFNAASEARIIRDYKVRLGQQVDIAISKVPEIYPEKSGKFRYVVSNAPIPGIAP